MQLVQRLGRRLNVSQTARTAHSLGAAWLQPVAFFKMQDHLVIRAEVTGVEIKAA